MLALRMPRPAAPRLARSACRLRSHTNVRWQSSGAGAGRLYTFGAGKEGQLGLGTDNREDKPKEVAGVTDGVELSLGLYHTLVRCTGGAVVGFGKGGGGRLGKGDETNEYEPLRVGQLSALRVAQVAAGGLHSAVLDEEGRLYTFGFGGYGQLGHGEEVMKLLEPRRVEVLAGMPLRHVSCGGTHMAAVSREGEVFAWGREDQGRLGIPAGTSDSGLQCSPVRLARAPKDVRAVSCGGFHTALLTGEGRVFTFGGGQNGELGTGEMANRHEARGVQGPLGQRRVVEVRCGGLHTVALTEDGELGTGSLASEPRPRLVEALRGVRVTHVAAGGSHTLATDGERLWAWGANREGALGHEGGVTGSPAEVTGLPPGRLLALGAGGHHSAVLLAPPP
eukprot:tig00001130_g7237.t1